MKIMLHAATAILLGSSLLLTWFDACARQFPASAEYSNQVFTTNPERSLRNSPSHLGPNHCRIRGVAEVQPAVAPPSPDRTPFASRFDWEIDPLECSKFGLGAILSSSTTRLPQLVLRI